VYYMIGGMICGTIIFAIGMIFGVALYKAGGM
jgi:hypothetical protein